MKRPTKLNNVKRRILRQSNVQLRLLSEKKLVDIAQHPLYLKEFTEEELVEFLKVANALYRGGDQLISDTDYDTILEELRKRNPIIFLMPPISSPNGASQYSCLVRRQIHSIKGFQYFAWNLGIPFISSRWHGIIGFTVCHMILPSD